MKFRIYYYTDGTVKLTKIINNKELAIFSNIQKGDIIEFETEISESSKAEYIYKENNRNNK